MPRGFPPTLKVAVSLSVAVSITDTVAEPSLDTYANGAAKALRAVAADRIVAPIMSRAKHMTVVSPSNYGGAPQWSLCYTTLRKLIGHPDRGRTYAAPRMSDSARSDRRGDRRGNVAADRV